MGISRHGYIAAERLANKPQTRSRLRQSVSFVGSSALIGLGVSLFVHARLGVPSFDVMLTALRDLLGVSLGQALWLFTGSMFVVAAALGRPPRFSSLLWLGANGASVDVFLSLIRDPESPLVRVLFVAMGTTAIATAVALVVHAGFTGGSLELLSLAAEDRGLDPFVVRRNIEIAIVIVGFTLGGDLGPATLVFALTMSPLLRAGRQALDDHRVGRELRLAR